MTGHPLYDELREDILRGVSTAEDWFHRHDTHAQTPAARPATMKPATQQEDHMSLATIGSIRR